MAVSFGGDDNVQKLIVLMVAHLCELYVHLNGGRELETGPLLDIYLSESY